MQKNTERPDMVKSTRQSVLIVKALDQLLSQFNADRGYVYGYHRDGDLFLATNTHERTQLGVLSVGPNMQGIPCSMFSYLNTRLLKDGELRVPSVAVRAQDSRYFQRQLDNGIKSFYKFGIFSKHKDLIGFWGIDFIKNQVTLTKDDLSGSAVRF